jgi:hypothetical protein
VTATIIPVGRARGQTPYEYRLSLVLGVLQDQAGLHGPAARNAAVLVLRSIDTIPESVR